MLLLGENSEVILSLFLCTGRDRAAEVLSTEVVCATSLVGGGTEDLDGDGGRREEEVLLIRERHWSKYLPCRLDSATSHQHIIHIHTALHKFIQRYAATILVFVQFIELHMP